MLVVVVDQILFVQITQDELVNSLIVFLVDKLVALHELVWLENVLYDEFDLANIEGFRDDLLLALLLVREELEFT